MTALAGKKVVVTGANRGIGRAIAVACARAGAIVGLGHRAPSPELDALVAETSGIALRFDVRDHASVMAAVASFVEREKTIDAWVNNAGVNRACLLATASPEDVRAQLDTNLLGPITCTQAVLPVMLRARRGVILNVSSLAASRPVRGQSVYAATKGGLEAFTRAIAVEYGRKNIRCVCIAPGPIDTDMLAATRALAEDEVLARVPLQRIGRAEEVAALAVYLLSDAAAFVTGSVHAIDGGASS